MNLKLWACLRFVAPLLVGIIPVIFYAVTKEQYGEITLGMVVVLGSLYRMADRIFWKCPYCGEYIGRNRVKTCRNCDENVFS
ncbi:MAG: hypothetical protein R3Y63_14230 [Eubacteriales bacterium]